MHFKNLFEPKKLATFVPDNKISIPLIKYLLGMYLLVLITNFILIPRLFTDTLAMLKTQNAGLSIGTIVLSFIIIIFIIVATELIILAVVTLLTKLVLKIAKRTLTTTKIINLYLYKWIVNVFLVQIIGLIILVALKLSLLNGDMSTLEGLKSLTPEQVNKLINNIFQIIGFILSFSVFIYTVKIASSIQRKN